MGVCPVSYTHLDVYKRQQKGWTANKPLSHRALQRYIQRCSDQGFGISP